MINFDVRLGMANSRFYQRSEADIAIGDAIPKVVHCLMGDIWHRPQVGRDLKKPSYAIDRLWMVWMALSLKLRFSRT